MKHDISEMLKHLYVKRLDEEEGPSFPAVVALSGVVLVVVFLGALLLVGVEGSGMLPNIHRPDLEPTSMLVMPASARTV